MIEISVIFQSTIYILKSNCFARIEFGGEVTGTIYETGHSISVARFKCRGPWWQRGYSEYYDEVCARI